MSEHEPRGMTRFVVIWLGQCISLLGSGLTNFALGVWIFEQTGQATPFALTVLFGSLPRILLAPFAGVVADRFNRRLVMIVADGGDALVTLVALLLLVSGDLAVWHIYLIALCSSLFATFQEPAYTASITMLVPNVHLPRASGLIQLSQAIEALLTPALAGLLFVMVGLRGIMLIDFVTFFAAIGALLLVRIPQPPAEPHTTGQPRSVWRDATFGWHYIRQRHGLFLLLWYFALVNFLMNFASILTVPLVLSFGSPRTLGMVQTMMGLALLVGSLAISAWGAPRHRVQIVIASVALAAVGLALTGLRPSLLVVGGGSFVLLLCIPIASAASQALFQTKVAPALQGRVFAIRSMISRSMMPLAFISSGLLADHVFEPLMQSGGALAHTPLGTILGVGPGRGIGLMFVLAGTLLLGVSGLALTNPRLRRLEDELPDHRTASAEETPPTTPSPVAT